MKKLFTFLFLLLRVSIGNQVFGQDKILDRGGNEQIVIVTDISPDSVFYREIADSVAHKVYSINKKQLFMITFKNGTKEVFPEDAGNAEVPKLTKEEYYRIGKQDASTNFKSKSAFWGTFAATMVPVLWPAGGIATGAAVSLSNPDKKNVIARNPDYKQNVDYLDGYNNQAKKKKLGSAAGGLGAAVGLYFVAIAVVFSGVL